MSYRNYPQYSGDPSAVSDGDIWYDIVAGVFRKKENGVISDLDTGGSGGGYYEPLTNGIAATPELIFALGDVIMVLVV